MLCEKCEKMACGSRNEALALSAKLGIGGRHTVNGSWYPGDNPKTLEDWCIKNCKEVKEEVVTSSNTVEDKVKEEVKTADKKKE